MGLGLATPSIAGLARVGPAGEESPGAGFAAGVELEPHPAATSHASKAPAAPIRRRDIEGSPPAENREDGTHDKRRTVTILISDAKKLKDK
jgi:hypothetical protein